MILNTIEDKLDILSGYDLYDAVFSYDSLFESVSFLRKTREVADLIFLARNSDSAFYIIVDRFGSYLDAYREDDEDDAMRCFSWEVILSSLLIVLVEADQVFASMCSNEVLAEDAPPLLQIIARTHLLEEYGKNDRIRKLA